MMKRWAIVALLLGLAAVTAMVAWQGFGTIAEALAALGAGVLLLPLVFLPNILFAALSWEMLFRPGHAPRFAVTLRAMWMGLSVDTLLPVARIGGEVVKARIVNMSGTPGTEAAASVVGDKTVQAISIVLWGLVGLAALAAVGADRAVVGGALVATTLLAAGVAGFIYVQCIGPLGFMAKVVRRDKSSAKWDGMVDTAVNLDSRIRELYCRPGRIVGASALRLVSRLMLTFEVWLAAHLMGHPISLWEALMLKTLTDVLRGAAFAVPGGWGVQEGSFVIFGGALGLTPDFTLALSLATRARELLVSLPGLLAWQHAEGRSFLRRETSQ